MTKIEIMICYTIIKNSDLNYFEWRCKKIIGFNLDGLQKRRISMTKVFQSLKFLLDPHKENIQAAKSRYQKLDDLSNIAVDIGDVMAYKSLQIEMKEAFFDYLAAIAIDSIYKLIPHVLIIWLISLRWQSITIPVANWKANILGAYLLAYLIFYFAQLIAVRVKNSLANKRLIRI